MRLSPARRHPPSRGHASTGLLRTWTLAATSIALAAAGLALAGAASAQPVSQAAARPAARAMPATLRTAAPAPVRLNKHDYKRACAATTRPGRMACMVLVRTNVRQKSQAAVLRSAASLHAGVSPAAAPPTGVGFGPASLQSAYNLPSATAGSGETVAIVDAMDDPNAASDLATYRADWGLPACGAGCFTKVNQNGAASPLPTVSGTTGWATEESLDLDMVSAICPLCHIILVEANSPTTQNLGTGVNTAVSLGAEFVSNSYGGSESASDSTFDTEFYKHAGVAVTASAGDNGFGVEYPAASQFVTAVGGTSLTQATNTRGWTETVWGSSAGGEGTGSGCSADDAKPTWQTDTGCARRTNNDVSADANPNTGVAVFDTYDQNGWLEVGGTSASSPMIAATFALAGTPAAGTFPSSYIYQHTSSLFDVTSGADGSCSPAYLCTGEVGYDGPTGWGTPNGVTAFTSGAATGNTVTVTNPGSQSGTVGTAASLQIHATDSATGQTLSYSATGLPAGLSISASTGLISGTPTTAGTSTVAVTATDSTGAKGSATFSWTIAGAGGTGCTAAQLLGNPGFETGAIAPWTSTAGVLNNISAGVPAHSGSWLAWLDGYGTAHTDTLSQTVTIPSTCTSATLSFWLEIQTNDPATRASDTFTTQVLNSSGTVLATLSTLSNQNSGGYAQHTFSLTQFIGQTITIKFTGKETLAGHNTSFFEDDNALNVS
ncbi:MAG TPA: putative Ig domain-containing protein [Streptosporangiaceae bacterium]